MLHDRGARRRANHALSGNDTRALARDLELLYRCCRLCCGPSRRTLQQCRQLATSSSPQPVLPGKRRCHTRHRIRHPHTLSNGRHSLLRASASGGRLALQAPAKRRATAPLRWDGSLLTFERSVRGASPHCPEQRSLRSDEEEACCKRVEADLRRAMLKLNAIETRMLLDRVDALDNTEAYGSPSEELGGS